MSASLIMTAAPLALCFIYGAVELSRIIAQVRGEQNVRGEQ